MLSKIYIENFGCSTNIADGKVIAGCVKEAGYRIVDNSSKADILIYNTCAVKSPTEDKIIAKIRNTPPGRKIIVSGCLPLIALKRLKKEARFDGAIGPAPGIEIINIIKKVENKENVIMLNRDFKPALSLSRYPPNNIIEILPISYGCLGDCSFCCVRHARGKLRSYTIEEILKKVENFLANNTKEIWLTAQDLTSYGKDIGKNLVELLEKLTRIEGKFKIRLGMMNPNTASNMIDGLIEIYSSEKFFKFLHLPVQSGDNEILRLMNRHYTIEDFKKIVYTLRYKHPHLTLSTDFICGYPGETEKNFENSLKLIREVKPDIINISKFYSRPKTITNNKLKLSTAEIKERTRKMTNLANKVTLAKNQEWITWSGEIILDEVGYDNSIIGRNFAYKPIAIENEKELLGHYVNVTIKKALSKYLEGVIIT